MILAAEKTREVFWHLPPWAEILWYFLATLSVAVFLFGVARPVAKYRRGRRVGLPPASELPERIRRAIGIVTSHSSIARRDSYSGWAHRGIFYGFTALFIGTIILAINTDVTERFFGWRFFQGNFYLAYSLTLDVMGLALLAGLLMMMVRRALIRPRQLDYGRPDRATDDPAQARTGYRIGDWVFVGGLLYLVLTGYMLEGIRIYMDNPGYNAFSGAGWVFSRFWAATGITGQPLEVLRQIGWWSHGLVAITFVAAIPYTKAVHMLTGFVGLVLRDPRAGSRLQPVSEAAAEEPIGYSRLADFSITHLLDLDACTKCGRCHAVCPANNSQRPLSPRDVVLELREEANTAMAGIGVSGVLDGLLHGDGDGRLDVPVIGENRVRPETLWACMQCNACVEICPVGIEQAPIINQMRRSLVEEGEMEPQLSKTLRTIQKSGNSFGERGRKRGRWVDELEFEIKDAREEPVDVLWFVGDYASFDPRSQEVTRGIARLLRAADVDFGLLYDGERNAGNDVRRVGEEGLFEALAAHNIEVLGDCEFNRIMTSDPHSLNTLRNEYGDFGGTWEVVHHTALLLELLESGALGLSGPLGYRVTYHDPCYLGRHNGGYDAPREIMRLLGCELREMPRNRDNSYCCGAGGGRIWMTDPPGAPRPAEQRIEEAVGLGGLDYFVVTCPKDVTMYEDAIKTSGNSEQIELRELTELILESARGLPEDRVTAGVGAS